MKDKEQDEEIIGAVLAAVGRYGQVPVLGTDGGVGMLFAVLRGSEKFNDTSGAHEQE